jgi:uncharacterized protein (TIGR02001 family)
MKKIISLGLGALGMALATTSPALAVDGLTANAAFTTNYIFRGVSQSGADPAIQAGLDYDLNQVGLSGFSVGTWTSSINFGDTSPFEWDIYGSYTGAITDKLSWSAGAIAYLYPNTPTSPTFDDWMEGWAALSYNFDVLSVTGKVFYSPDYLNLNVSQVYYNGAVSIPIAPWLALNGSFGYTNIENDVPPLIKSYTDWGVNLAATFEAYTMTVGYTSTDLDGVYEVVSGPFQTTEQIFFMFSFRFM